jgi:ubiquinone/menaquinone biosynthesis C-methylase UbiE
MRTNKLTPKPAHLGPHYGALFQDHSVARAYYARAPYPPAFFDILETLQSPIQRGRILELGCGTGDATIGLAACAERVDAVEPSAAMLSVARCRPGANDTRIRWVHATAEQIEFEGPYSLALAAESLHWMEWDVVLPKVAAALTPGAFLVVVERGTRECMPWDAELRDLISKHSTNREYRPYDLIMELTSRGLFREIGRCTTLAAPFTQPIQAQIELMHSRNGFSRARMSAESAAKFDALYRQLLDRYCADDIVRLQTVVEIVWGVPAPA